MAGDPAEAPEDNSENKQRFEEVAGPGDVSEGHQKHHEQCEQ